jgi:hypothetical protein
MPLFGQVDPLFAAYSYAMIDVPGVIAANNFLSIFNPANSGKVHIPLEIGMTSYSIAMVQVPNSLAAYRTTAASGGSLVAAANILKFQTTMVDAASQVRIGNPTVTTLSSTPLVFKSPVVAGAGGGNNGTVTVEALVRNRLGVALLPGEGIVFATAVGLVNELWNIGYAWGELLL